jgi:hypothetical protein
MTNVTTGEPARRSPGNFDFYQRQGDRWACRTCGSEIKAVIRHASIWDGPGPCAGSGEVETYQEPYCPQCEVKPV